jgi:hypothetical protein
LVAGIQGGKRLTVSENGASSRIFGRKRDEVKVGWKNYVLRSFMLCTAYQNFFCNKIEKNEMGGACRAYGEGKGVYRGLVVKPEGMR